MHIYSFVYNFGIFVAFYNVINRLNNIYDFFSLVFWVSIKDIPLELPRFPSDYNKCLSVFQNL